MRKLTECDGFIRRPHADGGSVKFTSARSLLTYLEIARAGRCQAWSGRPRILGQGRQ